MPVCTREACLYAYYIYENRDVFVLTIDVFYSTAATRERMVLLSCMLLGAGTLLGNCPEIQRRARRLLKKNSNSLLP